MRLAGRRVLISGAASGIGRATAQVFRREGAAVALVDREAEALARTLEALCATTGPPAVAHGADVTDEAALRDAIEQSARGLGGLDGIVAAAGVDLLRPFDRMSREAWQSVLDVNLTGPFLLCRHALPHLLEAGGGTIVHIASGAGLRPLADRTAYCASKAGLVMFAKALAVDLAPSNVRVNAICPGAIDTPMLREPLSRSANPGAELESILDRYLIRRLGQPEDIAHAALFLSSAESAQVTGVALAVDGGRTFH
ncbi:MAG: SDR family oxidoreductase [Burkholderiales bacterium]|nr:MAG: SDR family oxidoreductase [Burkholderiales bacterium]